MTFSKSIADSIHRLLALAAALLIGLAPSLRAEQSAIDHFSIVSPKTITEGETAPVTVRAEAKDKSLIDTADNDLIISITSREEGSVEIHAKLENGVVSISHDFKTPGSHLIKVSDAANPKFFKLGGVTVLAKVKAIPEVRP
jgi:hypothetical protein